MKNNKIINALCVTKVLMGLFIQCAPMCTNIHAMQPWALNDLFLAWEARTYGNTSNSLLFPILIEKNKQEEEVEEEEEEKNDEDSDKNSNAIIIHKAIKETPLPQKNTNEFYHCFYEPCSNQCKKIYDTKRAFENHIANLIITFNIKPYTCPLCFNISYASPSGISSHVLKSHENEKFICKICAHQSMTAIKLLYHYYRNHNGMPEP